MRSPDLTRDRIRAVLADGPLTAQGLRDALGVTADMKGSWGALRCQLFTMTKEGHLARDDEGRYHVARRSPGSPDARVRERDAAVRGYLAEHGPCTARTVALALGMTQPSVRRALVSIGAERGDEFPALWRLEA